MGGALTPADLVGLLAEPERLRVTAAIVLGADTPSAVGSAAGLDRRAVVRALQRLTAGGLVAVVDGRLRVDVEAFKRAAIQAAPAPESDDHGATDPDVAAVLRAFVKGRRLVSVPVARGKRRTVLEHVAMSFEPGVRYPERRVDAILRSWHEDHAALRRYLVDEGLLARESGEYWRAGGWVDV